MQEGYYISKISLVITYKKNIVFWQFADILSAGYSQFIYHSEPRVGDHANNSIHNRTQWFNMLQSLNKSRHCDK